MFLHADEGTSTFIVVHCSLLSHLACPVVLTDCLLYLVLHEKCAAGLGGVFWTQHLQNELWGQMVTGLS